MALAQKVDTEKMSFILQSKETVSSLYLRMFFILGPVVVFPIYVFIPTTGRPAVEKKAANKILMFI